MHPQYICICTCSDLRLRRTTWWSLSEGEPSAIALVLLFIRCSFRINCLLISIEFNENCNELYSFICAARSSLIPAPRTPLFYTEINLTRLPSVPSTIFLPCHASFHFNHTVISKLQRRRFRPSPGDNWPMEAFLSQTLFEILIHHERWESVSSGGLTVATLYKIQSQEGRSPDNNFVVRRPESVHKHNAPHRQGKSMWNNLKKEWCDPSSLATYRKPST